MFRRHNTNNIAWIHWLGFLSFKAVFWEVFLSTKELFPSLLSTLLNFDQLLSEYSSSIIERQGGITHVSLVEGLVLLAFIGIYVYIFLLFNLQFDFDGIMALICTALTIFLLHIIHFVFIDKNPLTVSAILSTLPFSGLFTLLKVSLGAKVMFPNNANITNVTDGPNLDLS